MQSGTSLINECVVEKNISDDGSDGCEQFEEWSTFSSVHQEENNKDSSCFGDWTTFNGCLVEEAEFVPLSPQEGDTSGFEHKVDSEDEVNPWTVFHECFHVEETLKDTETTEIPPLSQLLHNPTSIPNHPAVISREGASLYHHVLCEPKSLTRYGAKHSLYSQKQLIDLLQLKHSDIIESQNSDLCDLGIEELESNPAALIQTKLTAPTWCQNTPGVFYQISRQWLSHHNVKLQNHQDKKDLL
ncbi:uncharacterized protein si:dkey-229e3.2 [Trichomycterus rosablanca]|uniref:uncharacterized protein si:dkey-229e3.2 n=1 Tax=Trichomycterus rosablanca TaxID=2290929 RepID=UPI002F355C96